MKNQLKNKFVKTTLLTLLAFGTSVASRAITFEYVTSSIDGGGTFSATATFDDADLGQGWLSKSPLDFSASLSGNSKSVDRGWEHDEIMTGFSRYSIDADGNLMFNYLFLLDNDAGLYPMLLNHGANTFSSPVAILGTWVEKITSVVVPPTNSIIPGGPAPIATPEGAPGAAFAAAVGGLFVLAGSLRRKNS